MKDFMNHRYIRKRALYLVTIAKHLKGQSFIEDEMKFTYHHGDHFKPILVISLKGKLLSTFNYWHILFASVK